MGNIKFEHIRNATSKITYKGITFLIDPMLAPKDAYPGFEGTYNNHLRFPLVDLPNSIMEILKDVDAIIVTHTHLDHWDNYAVENIKKDIPIFVQNKKDYNIIKEQGFKNIFILELGVIPKVSSAIFKFISSPFAVTISLSKIEIESLILPEEFS